MMLQQKTVRFSDEASVCEECRGQGFVLRDYDEDANPSDRKDNYAGVIQSPGKFQGEPLATYHAYHVMLDGFADENTLAIEDGGPAWLIGNVVCEESEQGFVTCSIFSTDAEAEAVWEKMAPVEEEGEC